MAYYVTISDFESRVNQIDGIIPTNPNIDTMLGNGLNLRQMKENAEANLRGLLNVLGYGNTDLATAMKDLNRRIQEFQATTASFNGPRLRAEIMNPLKGIVVNDMQNELNNFQSFISEKADEVGDVFIQIVEQITNDQRAITGIEEPLARDIAAEFYAQLNQIIFNFNTGTVTVSGSKGGGQRVSKEYKELTENVIKKIQNGIKSVNFTGRLNPDIKQLIHKDRNFTRRLLLLAQSRGIDVSHIYEAKAPAPVMEMTNNGDSLTIYYDILTPFLEVMAPSDSKGTKAESAARAYFEGLPEGKKQAEINKLCSRAQEFLGKFFYTSNLSGERAAFLEGKFNQAIRDIVTNYPAALFTGGNEQGIIGILGEIQGLYYMYSLLGENAPSVPPETLFKWIGGDTTAGGGVKTGADLVVQIAEHLGYGIQIKNSMDLTGATSFSDFTLNRGEVDGSFLDQLRAFGVPEDIRSALEDVFVMQSFNISYHLAGTIAVAGSPKGPYADVYLSTYARLAELIARAQRYMALAAAMIMRIQYLQGQGFEQSNTLWLVGGSAIISAAQILDDLIHQIEGELDGNIFRTQSTTRMDKTSMTIVDYLNGGHSTTSNLKTVLKTSYNFHKTRAL